MKRPELLARVAVGALVFLAVAAPLWIRSNTLLIHARMADSGGWNPDVIHAQAGKPVYLRLTSDDVMHGFAVGQVDMQSVDVEPGKVTDLALNFPKPGRYTFYCTRWCGIDHWRMRGTIEVSGDDPQPGRSVVPLYVKLGLDLDAPRAAPVTPASPPSVASGQALVGSTDLTSSILGLDFYRAHSPYETWKQLRNEPALAQRSDADIWNLVAFIWQSNTTAGSVANGQKLFAQNCAACHGAGGKGDGVFATQLAAKGAGGGLNLMIQRPANLADPQRMLAASPALLQGKILRGGMGTGMPSWGPIFTDRQVWDIVGYLYTFQFPEDGR